MSEIRVTFVLRLDDPAAPTAEEIASGVQLTEELRFVRDESARHSLVLAPDTRSFEVARWPDGSTSVREVDKDGRPGEWIVIP